MEYSKSLAQRWACAVVLMLVMVAASMRTCDAKPQELTAYWNETQGTIETVSGIQDDGLAWASYDDIIATTGWASLTLVGSRARDISDERKAWAMGYLEGLLSHSRIYDAYYNIIQSSHPVSSHVHAFAAQQLRWMRDQVKAYPASAYWRHVGISLAQLEGMAAGYNASASPRLPFEQFYLLANAGDLEDLINLPPSVAGAPVRRGIDIPAEPAQAAPIWDRAGKSMECSGLIKLTADGNALFAGHATFNMYSYMLRVFKHYTYNIRSFPTAAQTVSFSSRPGDLESKDDFYLLDSGLVVMETSLAVFNKSLYERLTPQSVPCWVRVNVANRLANTANEWAELFGRENSGTHNNQWIALDYNQYQKAKQVARTRGQAKLKLLPNTVWMVEQMPGVMEQADVTYTLLQDQLYVPSYNIPYFPLIFNISGYRAANYSYENDPRAKMFRAYSSRVTSLQDMGHFMNSNDWQRDPLSLGNPCNAISARCDLEATGAYAFGGIDAKVTSDDLAYEQQVRAISGPSHQNQPPFSWSPSWASIAHRGMPDTWDFDWQDMQPYRP